ncbi:MAG: hypothetical protein IT357_01900 [Gemmatimonadaceae bacterium]|nr:hypothetical protein [Gemmatimonadaceae bacterium]
MTSRPELKRITKEGVPAALQKAHRYRVLNDSVAAESICLDVLTVDPANVEAVVTHVLAITDQFHAGHAADRARAEAAVGALTDPYRLAYYQGVICERWATGILRRAGPRSGEIAHEWFAKALDWYAKAEAMRPAGNDEAILRWNTCVRILQREPGIRPRGVEAWEPSLE